MEEIWKDIKEFEGKYQISNLGGIFRKPRKVKTQHGFRVIKGCTSAIQDNGKGYKQIYVSIDKKKNNALYPQACG